ncbi:MAG: META domain-containing protein [Pseudomonadota bacterium]
MTRLRPILLLVPTLALVGACSAPIAETSGPDASEFASDAAPTPSEPVAVASLSEIEGAWQGLNGDAVELIEIRPDGEIFYDTNDFDQAGWMIAAVEDGRILLDYTRGPGLSSVDFPDGDYPVYDVLRSGGVSAVLSEGDLLLGDTDPVRLTPHPARRFALPQDKVWKLVESYDDLAERSPEEFSQAYITFNGYSVGAYGGCNGGGGSFVQDEDGFRPSPLMMTQMYCPNDGDAVAGWMVRQGPPFQRDGDRLWRDFPEGRVSFEVRDLPERR